MENKPLTIPEAAAHLAIGQSTLRRYLRRRLLSYIVLPGNDQRNEPAHANARGGRNCPAHGWPALGGRR